MAQYNLFQSGILLNKILISFDYRKHILLILIMGYAGHGLNF